MKIGIDASRAFLKDRTGIEEYSYQVIKHLAGKLNDYEVVLYVMKNLSRRKTGETSEIKKANWIPKNWTIKVIDWPFFWTQGGLALEMFKNPPDVLFVPAHTVPWIHPEKTAVTIHGLEYEKVPEAYSFWERTYMRFSIRASCHWAKKIIAVSKNTKQDICDLYGIEAEKIEVVYEGVDTDGKREFFSKRDGESKKNNLIDEILAKKYLLFVGRIEKRKNIEGILEAYKTLRENKKIPHNLVLAGRPGYGYEDIKLKIQESKGKIFELGYIDENAKRGLLSGADVFLFPSFYEGFGLPVLEAQLAGVPVIVSNTSSLPEVGGDGAFYCDPSEPESIAQSVLAGLAEDDKRDDMIKKGRENAEKFSWSRCARETAEIIRKI